MRPYGGYYYNLGRETFLVPVRWEEDWPIVSPGTGRVEFEYPAPNLPEKKWDAMPARDDFDAAALAYHWNFLRTPREDFYSLTERPDYLRLQLRPQATFANKAIPVLWDVGSSISTSLLKPKWSSHRNPNMNVPGLCLSKTMISISDLLLAMITNL